MRTFLRVLRLLWPYRRSLVLATLVGTLATILAIPGPYLTKILIDDVAPAKDVGLLIAVLITTAATSLFLGLTGFAQSLFNQRLGALMGIDFQQRLLHRVHSQDLAFFDRWQTGEILARFEDMDASLSTVISLINGLVLNGLYLLIFPIVLLTLDWQLALLSLAVLPIDAVLVLIIGRIQRHFSRRVAEQSAQLQARSVEALSNARLVQSLSMETAVCHRLGGLLQGVSRLQVQATALGGGLGFVSLVARTFSTTVYAWYGWNRVIEGNMTAGTFIAFSSYVGYLYGPIQSMLSLWPSVQTVKVHGERFLELLDMESQITAPARGVERMVKGRIQLDDVAFQYPDKQVFRNVNLTVEPGEFVALCGPSGSGKSTLGLLLARFHDPSSGRVYLDGDDLRDWDLACLRRQVRIVLQGANVFSGTVMENLTLGQDVALSRIEMAAKVAQLDGVVADLPQRWATTLGEGGVGLSEGQRQRLGLARALLMQPPVLILDEPTAALDADTSTRFGEQLVLARRGMTTIVITHQQEMAAMMDRQVVLDGIAQKQDGLQSVITGSNRE